MKLFTKHLGLPVAVILVVLCVNNEAKFKRRGPENWPPIPPVPVPDKDDIPEHIKAVPDPAGYAGTAMGMFSGPKRLTKPELKVNGTYVVDMVMETVRRQVIKLGLNEINPPDIEFSEEGCKIGLYEGKIIGFANFHRVGDVTTVTEPLATKFRSAFGYTDLSYDSNVEMVCGETNYDAGHVSITFENVTLHQVFKFNHATQILELDEFEVSMGEAVSDISGLGDHTAKGSKIANKIVEKTKQPILDVLNVSLKVAVNIALTAARAAMTPIPG